jgi:hypothetical protein
MPALDLIDWLDAIAFARRRLRRTPTFAAAAAALPGVGITIAAATISLLNVALFKDAAGDQGLVHIGIHSWVSFLPDEVVARGLADPPASLDSLAAFGPHPRRGGGRRGVTAGGLLVGSLFVRGNVRLLDPAAIATEGGFRFVAGLVGAIAPYVLTIRACDSSLSA